MKKKARIPNPVSRILKLCEQIDPVNHDFIANDPRVLRWTSEALALKDQRRPDEIEVVLEKVAEFARSFNAEHIAYSNVQVGDLVAFRTNNKSTVHAVRVIEKTRLGMKVQSDEPNPALPFPQHIPHLVKWSPRLNCYYSGMGWIVPNGEEKES